MKKLKLTSFFAFIFVFTAYTQSTPEILDQLKDVNQSFENLNHRLDVLEKKIDDVLWFDRVGDDLRVIAGEGRDNVTIENWFRSEFDRVDRFETKAGLRLVADEVQLLVQAMAAYSLDDDAVSVPQSAYDAMAPIIAETWHTV